MHEEINAATKVLLNGGLILYPTDTIWGIGCDATNVEAVNRIYRLKKRSDAKSMLVLMDSVTRLSQYLQEIPEIAFELLEVADKPLTIIYPEARNLAKNLLASDRTIGIRLVKDKFCTELIRHCKKPVVSTSANISGEIAPGIFSDIAEEIKTGVDYVVNYRQDQTVPKKPSSIIKLGIGGEIEILRK